MAGESRTQDNVNKSRAVLDIPGQLEPMVPTKRPRGSNQLTVSCKCVTTAFFKGITKIPENRIRDTYIMGPSRPVLPPSKFPPNSMEDLSKPTCCVSKTIFGMSGMDRQEDANVLFLKQ